MGMPKRCVWTIILLAGYCCPIFAFGPTGHRVVARVAENHLTESAQEKVSKLLGEQRLSEVATWASDMEQAENSKFWNETAPRWHQVAVPLGDHYQTPVKRQQGDAYIALDKFIRVLKSPHSSAKEKNFALKFLTHTVGDLHQPMQTPVNKEGQPEQLPIEWMGQESDLVFVWEQGILDTQKLSFTELAEFVDTKNDDIVQRYQSKLPIEWVDETLSLREKIVKTKPEMADQKYVLKNFPIVKAQLRKAGIRLAGILNEIFTTPTGFDQELEQQTAQNGGLKRQ